MKIEKKKFDLVFKEMEYGQDTDKKKGAARKDAMKEVLIRAGCYILVLHIIYILYEYGYAANNLMRYVVNNSLIYILACSLIPFGWWTCSTMLDRWHFHYKKLIALHLCVINLILVTAQYIWTFSWEKFVRWIVKIETGRNFTKEMVIELARNALIFPCILFLYIGVREYKKHILNEINRPKIEAFRLQHIIDLRKNKRNLYDLRVMKDIKTGKDILIEAQDRSVHMFVLGASGTGKTSSVLEPMIIKDMNQKIKNMKKRVAHILQMFKDKKIYLDGISEDEVDESHIKAYPRFEKELADLKKKYADCGITFMAPNNDLNNRIVKAAKARGMKVNVIDPLKIYRDLNVNNLGINPFYVPLKADLYTQQEVITNTAAIFSEVLNAVNESGNESNDIYFKNLNTSVTMNVATVCMLYESMHDRYTYLSEIQDCITDFSKLQPMVEYIMQEFGLHIRVSNGAGKRRDADRNALQNRVHPVNDNEEFIPKMTEKAIMPRFRHMSLNEYNTMLRDVGMGYKTTLYTVLYELLGPGREKMEDQSRGLRNIIGNLLQDPRINRILNAKEGQFIKFDKILENNEITVINTGLAISPRCSTALGLFFQLCLKISVLRRPEDKRSTHFLVIDEASQYMHSMYEDMVALYRQYGVCVTIAMQATSQMAKNQTTRYLKDVVMGVGTHIVFGRTSAEEMELYSALAGIKNVEVIQNQINKTSLAEDSPQYSEGIKKSYEKKNLFEGTDIRQKDFQEITVFTVRGGRVLNPKAAKVAFAKESEYYDQHVRWVDFRKFILREETDEIKELPVIQRNESLEDIIDKDNSSYSVINIFRDDEITMGEQREVSGSRAAKSETDRNDNNGKGIRELGVPNRSDIAKSTESETDINFAMLLGLEKEQDSRKSDNEMEMQLKKLDRQTNNGSLI